MWISLYSTVGICNDSRVSLSFSLLSSLRTSEIPEEERVCQGPGGLSEGTNPRPDPTTTCRRGYQNQCRFCKDVVAVGANVAVGTNAVTNSAEPLKPEDVPATSLRCQALTLSVLRLAVCVPLGFVDGYEWDVWT